MGAGRLGPLQLLAGVAAAALLVALGSGQLGHRRKTTAVLTRDHDVVHVSWRNTQSAPIWFRREGLCSRSLACEGCQYMMGGVGGGRRSLRARRVTLQGFAIVGTAPVEMAPLRPTQPTPSPTL